MLDASTLSTLLRYDQQSQKTALELSLKAFMREAWHLYEPGTEFIDGWHLDAICAHLEAAAKGEIKLLLISMPPGHMKSGMVSVMFPAWVWTWAPFMRLLTSSYAGDLAERDAVASRMVIESDWYQSRWPMPLRRDTNRKARYENDQRGYRVATSVGSRRNTGEGGGILLVDDPISMGDVFSDAQRAEAIHWWDNVMTTRIRNQNPGARIMVGQRGHERDPIGHILAKNLPGTVYLCLPARFDPIRRCVTKWYADPRSKAGEPLWPGLYPERRLDELAAEMSPFAVASQLQQLPTVAGGAVLRRAWWKLWTEDKLPQMSRLLVSFDPANKKTDHGSRWACTVWGWWRPAPADKFERLTRKPAADEEGNLMLLDAWAEHMDYPTAKTKLMETVKEWEERTGEPPDYVIIEDKAAGSSLVTELGNAGIEGVMPYNPGKDDKHARANLVSDLLFHGRIWAHGKKFKDGTRSKLDLPKWAEEVVKECELFPGGEFDDLVDTCTQAWHFSRDLGRLSIETDAPLVEPERETTIKAGYYA